jgi:hypothetical protein
MEREDYEDTGSADNEAGHQSSKPNLIHKFLDNPLLIGCLVLGSVVSAGTDFVKIPELLKRAVDKDSVVLIKGVMMTRYLETQGCLILKYFKNSYIRKSGQICKVMSQ